MYDLKKLVVLIPALNEENSLEATLASIKAAQGAYEIIGADGESRDTTPAIAARYGRVVNTSPGRALRNPSGDSQRKSLRRPFTPGSSLTGPRGTPGRT